MRLKDFLEQLDDENKLLLLGRDTDNPLADAFDSKRTVHAGLGGQLVQPTEMQKTWGSLLDAPAPAIDKQLVYIHIPFCQTKCLYCAFFQNASNQAAEDYYIDCLIKDIKRECNKPRLRDSLIHAVFFGGGTPSSLSAFNVARLLQAVKESFNLANDYEMTMEGRIHDLVPEKIEAWINGGVNRVSLGVQSFDTKVRRQMARIDSKEEVLRRIGLLRATQQCSIVVDLIYGMPDQTLDVWEEDLKTLELADVDGFDLYQLNVFEGSDLNVAVQNNKLSSPATTAQQSQMYAFAQEYLSKRAYTRLSACHWRRDNRERSLYNTLVKRGYNIYPFGCGAGGNIDGYSTMLQRNIKTYQEGIEKGDKPLMALIKQPTVQKIIGAVLGQIEQGYIDLHSLVKLNPLLEELVEVFTIWEKRGLLAYNGVLYRLTIAGQFWQVNLAQSTLECIQALLLDKSDTVKQGVAAQDSKVSTCNDDNKKMLTLLQELYPEVPVEELQKMLMKMPAHVRSMLNGMPKVMLKQMLNSMGPEKLQEMMGKAKQQE
ncbi:MAG TPA: heme anaerobic degradation radical SAM methyltransferase ChuW/HutW [Candidatus Avacidaminococcus intestinavium]|uniref:Heme anaerobic degradation radical SAM methyltransferase ChuW/HutW n=1 Tax=Candidatus Avacidaminococcus intestinavium TaxID=2840684 RepID=A0A9D1SKD2_9FIRM|nr:heme anaerobic degradation radical SAM methyltransferase ChuW/HutW [Candidatus Avacidaminococcus intestinavium]